MHVCTELIYTLVHEYMSLPGYPKIMNGHSQPKSQTSLVMGLGCEQPGVPGFDSQPNVNNI